MRHCIAVLMAICIWGGGSAWAIPPEPADPGPAAEPQKEEPPAETPVLASDRPTFSEGAATVSNGYLQVEFGAEVQTAPLEKAMNLPLVLLRWGLGQAGEVRLFVPSVGVRWPKDGATLTDVGALGLGFKYAWDLLDGFRVAISPFLFLPLKSDQYDTEGVSLGGRLIAGLRFTDWMGATLNGGIEIAGLGGNSLAERNLYSLSLALDFSLIDGLSCFAEVFSVISDRKGDDVPVNVDLGLTWGLAPNWQLDVYAGMNTLEAPDEVFFGLGSVFLW